jgi:hypothetical protein
LLWAPSRSFPSRRRGRVGGRSAAPGSHSKETIAAGDGTATLNINKAGFVIAGMFIVTEAAAMIIWRYGHIEETWSARPQRGHEDTAERTSHPAASRPSAGNPPQNRPNRRRDSVL